MGRLGQSQVVRAPGACIHVAPVPVVPRCGRACLGYGICPMGQHCVNLCGSYRCLPDCGPGFRVASDGAGCEGDKGTVWGCPDSWEPSCWQDSAEGVLCVTRTLGLQGNGHSLDRRSAVRPGREPALASRGLSPGGLAAGSLVPLTRVSFLGLRLGVCPMQVDQVRDGNHMLHLPLLLFPLLGGGPA